MDFVRATELDGALAEKRERGAAVTVLAGGTDVVVQLLRGELRPTCLLYIGRLDELKGISVAERTEIGALVTHWELATSLSIASDHPARADAALTVGGRQTQNIGTIGGNVVNASPAADLLPALLAAEAHVRVASASRQRSLALGEFLTGRKQTALEPDELVTAISLERPPIRTGEAYVKLGRRRAMEVAIVGLAARLSFDEDGIVSDAKVAVCSVAPMAFRARDAEAALTGRRLDESALDEAGRLLQESARPIDDVRASAGYRRRVLPELLRRAAATCRARAKLENGEEDRWS